MSRRIALLFVTLSAVLLQSCDCFHLKSPLEWLQNNFVESPEEKLDSASLDGPKTTFRGPLERQQQSRTSVQISRGSHKAMKEGASTKESPDLANTVVRGLSLKVPSLEKFWTRFLGPEASCSLKKFMSQQGDRVLGEESTDWTSNEQKSRISRQIHYQHPVHVPLAPSMARARKEQTVHWESDNRLVVETKTFVSDLPLSDSFYVVDRLVAVSKPASSGGQQAVVVDLQFEIVFLKPCRYQRLISRTTDGEFRQFLQLYANFMMGSSINCVRERNFDAMLQAREAIAA